MQLHATFGRSVEIDPIVHARRPTFWFPLAVAAAAVAMLAGTWGTWPDPVIDYGMDLYIPWQLSTGHVLYRDIAYYNGPLSSYANAAVFRVFGAGLHRLEAANLMVLAVAMVLAYRLAARASGRAAAVAGGVTFAAVFAFGQAMPNANYNWVTPYVHELTHGITLGLVAVACMDRSLRTGRVRWAAAAGLAVGAALVTKAEPAVAAVAAVAVQAAAGLWVARVPGRRAVAVVGVTVGTAVIVPVLAFALLASAMPASMAFRGVLGSFPWAVDRRVTSLAFYRGVSGLDDVGGNLLTMARWSAGYAVVATAAVAVGLSVRRRGAVAAAASGAVAALAVSVLASRVRWGSALTPLPVCLVAVGAVAAWDVIRRRPADPGRAALRLGAVCFALAVLGKLLLKAHAYHYGFALAMPAGLVVVAVGFDELPAWVDRRGGRGVVVRAVAAVFWAAFVGHVLASDRAFLGEDHYTVAAGTPDSFRSSAGGWRWRPWSTG